jgi:hypothetical protein
MTPRHNTPRPTKEVDAIYKYEINVTDTTTTITWDPTIMN